MEKQPIIISLGSNLGQRALYLDRARQLLEQAFGKALEISSIYETPAWGKTDQDAFYNQIALYEPERIFSATEILKIILETEDAIGRVRFEKWGPRIIDIDLLYLGNTITANKYLKVPHPEIANRRFVLEPLAEIAPDFIDPVSGKSITQLLTDCADNSNLKKLSPHEV